jgi:hypothetical protein
MSRALAERLLDHAAKVMPANRRDWGLAMRTELVAIPSAGEALAFAGGCVWTAYSQRISLMRIALLTGRLAVAAVSLLTAVAHAFLPLYMLAIVADLKRNSLNGWAGGFPLFEDQTAESAAAGLLLMPAWHMAAMLGLAGVFGAAAWFVARGDFKRLPIAVGVGAAIHTANTLSLIATWPSPYLIHPALAWLDYLALALLLVAAAAFLGLDRWTTRARLAI